MIGFNVEKIRNDFPILNNKIVYLDSACMSLKPIQVIDKLNEYYLKYTACAGRSEHSFAGKVSTEMQKSRNEIKKLINAKEVVFTRNTTEGINLVANSLGFEKGDEVLISDKEHNSNLVPWLKLRKKGINVVVVKSNEDNTFNLESFEKKLNHKTKLVSVVHTSNMDGVTNPIKEIVKIAHKNNSKVLIDAAQAVPSQEINVKKLDVDFMAFSGHKMLGPTGTGVLYGKNLELLDQFIVGGETVMNSTYEGYTAEEVPMKFEAGLQDYAGLIALGEASKYLRKIGLKKINRHEVKLNKIITQELEEKVSIIGPKEAGLRNGIFSFNIKGLNPNHVSKILDTSRKIMTRGGAHCVHSWFNHRQMDGSCRASLYLYNTKEEVNVFVSEIKKIIKLGGIG